MPKPSDKFKETTTKQKVVKTFEGMGLVVPDTLKEEKKISKTDRRLIHVGVEHLFMGVLQHLTTATSELEKIVEKKDDDRAASLVKVTKLLTTDVTDAINALAEVVDEMPTVEDLTDVFVKLTKELEQAALLQLTDTDIPKEQMH